VPDPNATSAKNKKEEKKGKQKGTKKEEKKERTPPPPHPINSSIALYLYNNPARAHRDAATNKGKKTKSKNKNKSGVRSGTAEGRTAPSTRYPAKQLLNRHA